MKTYALVFSVIIIACGGFWFFHTTESVCTMARDPSGGMSPLCTLATPSPFQKLLLMQHTYFHPDETCAISAETGAIDCHTFTASGCDQSATTTDCASLAALPQEPPPSYLPPNPIQPTATWTSATGTPILLAGFSFELPAGWHGSVYSDAYLQNLHVLVQSDLNDHGFTIDCTPAGKGLESATRLSSEKRSFTSGDGTGYSVAFEKWTASGNDPWYFVWVRTPQSGDSLNGSSGTYCLAQGTATPDIEEAMRTMYESWR